MTAKTTRPWSLRAADVERSPRYAAGLAALVAQLGLPATEVARRSRACLEELRTGHSPSVYRRIVSAGRALLGSGYAPLDYDPAQIERMRTLFATQPTVVLSSHKSYLDGGALTVGFADHLLPPLTVFAGLNMAFWPIGQVWRRANGVFIRRAGHDAAYAFALRQQLGTLIERRQPLQWFIEGTRSRTGVLGPPRLGLLVYTVDAWREGRCDDLVLQPVAIAYDLLRDAAEYAREARGAGKRAETLGWLVRFVREQRGRFGRIYVRFGEPLSMRAAVGSPDRLPPRESSESRHVLEELAREVCRRIEAAMPVTATALVTLHLLATPPARPLTVTRLRQLLLGCLAHLGDQGATLTSAARELATPEGLDRTLDLLTTNGLVVESDDGASRAVAIAPGRELEAAYYRNTILHRLRDGALAELVAREARSDPAIPRSAPRAVDPIVVLRPEAESLWILAQTLESLGGAPLPVPDEFAALCLARGLEALAAGRLRHPESISMHAFRAALPLVQERGLDCGAGPNATEETTPDADLAARRTAFRQETHALLRRLEACAIVD